MTYFKNVVKRNGITVPFDEKKIENAIAKAFIATGEVEARNVSTIAGAITLMVITNLRENSQEIPTVEDIQDRVESMLMKCDYVKTAKAYILYRKQHQQAWLYRKRQGLAGKGKFHCHLKRRGSDPLQLRRYYRQLLAQRNL